MDNDTLYRAVIDALAEGIVIQDESGKILASNRSAERILQMTSDELHGRTSLDPEWRAVKENGEPFLGSEHPAMETLRTGEPRTGVVMGVLRRQERPTWISINTRPLKRSEAAAAHGVVCSFFDITESKNIESALRDGEQKYRSLFEHSMDGVLLTRPDGTILSANRAACSMLGRTEAEIIAGGRDQIVDVTDVRLRLALEERARTGRVSAEVTFMRSDGSKFPVAVTSALFFDERGQPRTSMLFRDISERQHLETLQARLMAQERLVTTGTLAAGVGHEINNPLTYVIGSVDSALEELRAVAGASPSGRMREILDMLADAREGADRIRKIVRGLRAFARGDTVLVPTDVHAAVEISVNMAAHELRQRATLTTELDPVPLVLADEAGLSQVLVNLIANAAQAFPTSEPDRNRIVIRSKTASDGRVLVEVSDTGPGISPEILPRIFDPFFTTKPTGQGTGLGLSICHNLVTALGGEITCATELGRGTTFTVLLPCSIEERSVEPAGVGAVGARRRVLIVDDEPVILSVVTRLLKNEHDVESCVDPREALRLLVQGSQDFDVIFCDLMMPYLTGMDLYREVLASRPEIARRFVFMTGGTIHAEPQQFLAEVENERIDKPFSGQNLRGIVRRFGGAAS